MASDQCQSRRLLLSIKLPAECPTLLLSGPIAEAFLLTRSGFRPAHHQLAKAAGIDPLQALMRHRPVVMPALTLPAAVAFSTCRGATSTRSCTPTSTRPDLSWQELCRVAARQHRRCDATLQLVLRRR